MKINKISSVLGATATVFTLLTAVPAKAVIFDWQFTNEDGNFGIGNEIVRGEVEFNDNDVSPNATDVAATSFTITSVTGLTDTSAPFFGDGGIELNENLTVEKKIGDNINNKWSFDSNSQPTGQTNTFSILSDDSNNFEQIFFREGLTGEVRFWNIDGFRSSSTTETILSDVDSSSLTFSEQTSASVPFEFSPTTGLFLVGGIFGLKRYVKHRQANRLVDK